MDINADGKVDAVATASGDNAISVAIGNGRGGFAAPVEYAVGTNPFWIANGDFNGDGKQDIVTANSGNNTISVLLGNGNGTFQPATSYGVGATPHFVLVGDFAGNGKLDIATANYASSSSQPVLSVFMGNGNGTFQTPWESTIQSQPWTIESSIAMADFNSDGKPDLAVANAYSGFTTLMIGNGDGTFHFGSNVSTFTQAGSVATGDFNGDGKADFVAVGTVGNAVSQVNVLTGNGDGTFQSAGTYYAGRGPGSVEVGDLNNDGNPDIVVTNADYNSLVGSNEAGGVSVLLNNGDGTFAPSTAYGTGSGPVSVAISDLNNDGASDLITADSAGNDLSLSLGVGDGTFSAPKMLLVDTTVTPNSSQPSAITAAGDFNGDGISDLATDDSYGGVSILKSNGDGTFQPAIKTAVGSNFRGMAAGNLDGRDGVVVGNIFDGTVWVEEDLGSTGFAKTLSYNVGGMPNGFAVADLNGDGHADIVVSFWNQSAVDVLLNAGDGTFATPQIFSGAGYNSTVTSGDLNGDGKLDIVQTGGSASVFSTLVNLGNNAVGQWLGLANPNTYSDGYGNISTNAVVGDFTRDGKPDVAVVSGNQSTVVVLPGNGDGTLGAVQVIAHLANLPTAILGADVNNDGLPDLVTADGTANSVSVLLNAGTTGGNWNGFSAGFAVPAGSFVYAAAAGDFNGDGKTDLATVNSSGENVTVVLQDPPPLAVPGGPYVADAGQGLTLDAGVPFPGEGSLYYEWDLDYDGTTFNPTVVGRSPTLTAPSTTGINTIALRVTDLAGANAIATTTLTTKVFPKPTAFTAAAVASDEIDLTWTEASPSTIGDVVYQSTDGIQFYPINQISPPTSGTANGYQVTGLTPGTAYWFHVTNVTADGQSAPTPTANVSTPFVAPELDVYGDGTAVEGTLYSMDLAAYFPEGEAGSIDHWSVDWKDGTAGNPDIITYSYGAGADTSAPLTVTHVFNAGTATPNVVATAVDGQGRQFVADAQQVLLTPTAPAGLTATFSGNSIQADFTTTSSISSGTTVLLSTDDVVFFEAAATTAGPTSATVSDLRPDTAYWIKVQTDGVNGISDQTTAVAVTIPYAQPNLVITPEAVPQEGNNYTLSLSATYAPNTPSEDIIDHWIVDWGNGQGPHSYGDNDFQNQSDVSGSYAAGTASATLLITAVDGTGRVIAAPPQTLLFAPPTPSSLNSTFDPGAVAATIDWQGLSDIPGKFVVQRQAPGSDEWSTLTTVPVTANGTMSSYSYTDPSPDPSGDSSYRVASAASGTSIYTSGSSGVSTYTIADAALPSGPQDVNNVSGVWSPAIRTATNQPVEFPSGTAVNFTMSNLSPHVVVEATIEGSYSGTGAGTYTITGPDGEKLIRTIGAGGEDDIIFQNAFAVSQARDATFTVQVDIPGLDASGNARTFEIAGGSGDTKVAGISIVGNGIDVGGETEYTVAATAGYHPVKGLHVKVVKFDKDVVAPVNGTVTLDAQGTAKLDVKGIGVGTSQFILEDDIGDRTTAQIAPEAPTIFSTGYATQGQTYPTGQEPEFVFRAPYPSVTPVTVKFTTAGSTLPASLMGALSGGEFQIPNDHAYPSLTVPFTPGDDGTIAPSRLLAVTPIVKGQAAYPFGPVTKMEVANTDKPTVSINGKTDKAAIQLDRAGETDKLTVFTLNSGTIDQDVDWSYFSWNSSDFRVWLTKPVGKPGTDLGSLPGAEHGFDGEVTYKFKGKPPALLYGQCLNGSSDWNKTVVTLTIEVSTAKTLLLPKVIRDATNTAHGTARGLTLYWSGHGDVSGSFAGSVMVGQKVDLEVGFSGPLPYGLSDVHSLWSISGNPIQELILSEEKGWTTVPFSADNSLSANFYWITGSISGKPNGVSVAVRIASEVFSTFCVIDAVMPDAQADGSISRPLFSPPDDGSYGYGTFPGSLKTAYAISSSVTAPGGVYRFNQKINFAYAFAYEGNTPATFSNVLDTRVWYNSTAGLADGKTGNVFGGDEPGLPKIPPKSAHAYYHAGFTDTLMYMPSGSDSIWVPLLSNTWGTFFDGKKTGPNAWTTARNSYSNPFKPTTTYPTWDGVGQGSD